MKRTVLMAFALLAAAPLWAQDPAPEQPQHYTMIKLWPNGAPGSAERRGEAEVARDYWVRNIHDPSLIAFPAPLVHRNGTAIVIMPGGGHKLWSGPTKVPRSRPRSIAWA